MRRRGVPHLYGTGGKCMPLMSCLYGDYLGRKFQRDDREVRSVVRGLVDQVCAAIAAPSKVVDEGTEDQKTDSKTTVSNSGDSAKNELLADTQIKADAPGM